MKEEDIKTFMQLQNEKENEAQKDITVDVDVEMSEEQSALKQKVIDALRTIYDPEIPVNIYDLGLIYNVTISSEKDVAIQMTLTAPTCPVAQTFPGMVENSLTQIEGVNSANVILVWDPPWSQDRMTEAAKLQLGLL